MKAIICTNYGPPEVLQIKDLPKPVPSDHEVLIKVYATSCHVGDTRIRKADPFLVRIMFGLFRPKKNLVLGLEVAGVVEAVGKEVEKFSPGDEVFALTGFGCKGYAEYICLPAKVKEGTQERKGVIAFKPENLSFGEAATVPAAALTVLKNYEKAKMKAGDHILINGASGSLGTFGIQMAKHYGAEVTAVCSGKNFELVTSLGADHTIDYTQEDFTQRDEQYDIVFDAVLKSSRRKCKRILKKSGIFVNSYGLPKTIEKDLWTIKDMVEKGIIWPVIDRTYRLDDVVEAHRYVDTGRKRGNVILTVIEEE